MAINPEAVGTKGTPTRRKWDSKDALLYSLGVGAGTDELAFKDLAVHLAAIVVKGHLEETGINLRVAARRGTAPGLETVAQGREVHDQGQEDRQRRAQSTLSQENRRGGRRRQSGALLQQVEDRRGRRRHPAGLDCSPLVSTSPLS